MADAPTSPPLPVLPSEPVPLAHHAQPLSPSPQLALGGRKRRTRSGRPIDATEQSRREGWGRHMAALRRSAAAKQPERTE